MAEGNRGSGMFELTPTLPWIREARSGHTLGIRAKYMERLAGASGGSIGPSDLVHWGRHYGEKSSKYLHNSFAASADSSRSKEEDGYVGYYHYVNGLDYSRGARQGIEEYLIRAIGLETTESGHFWRREVDLSSLGTYNEKQMVVTLCTYNVFSRCEVHARCVVFVHKSRKRPVSLDMSYTIHSHAQKKTHTYINSEADHIPQSMWDELAASSLMRLCVSTDDVARVLCGTVNLPFQVQNPSALNAAIYRLISVFPRAHLAGSRPAFGAVSTCGADFVKTSKFRNYVVDALMRVVSLDMTGNASEKAISQIRQLYGNEYDYVSCRLLQTNGSQNMDQRFLALVHENLVLEPRGSCMTALLMIEQARFLVARKNYQLATQIAARAVTLLPLDYDAWYTLALCYVLSGQYSRALDTINAFPVSFSKHDFSRRPYEIDGVYDPFAAAYIERTQQVKDQALLDLRTFESFFPTPKTAGFSGDEVASMASVWHHQFHNLAHSRHPVCGPFYRSPLAYATNLELSAVDPQLLKLTGPSSTKLAFAAQSAGDPWSSIIDFDYKSTWGRTYDLVTLMVTILGWDELVRVKNATFRRQKLEKSGEFIVDRANLAAPDATQWLQSLFLVVYEDIRVMVQISGQDHDRSALSWGAIGLLGWACKFNLKDTLSAIYTSVSGASPDTGFDYFGTVKMLEIYNEFVLSDVCASTIDPLSSSYDGRHYTNKLIVQNTSSELYSEFTRQLQKGHFSLDNVLLCLTKLICWNVRWYHYMPSSLVTETLIKLCTKYDPLVVRSTLQILMKTHIKKKTKPPAATFTLRGMFGAPSEENNISHQFVEGDTIMIYMAQLLEWIESLAEQK